MTWPIVDNTSVLNIDETTDSPAIWRSDGHALTERVRDLIGIRPRTVVKSAAYTVTPNDCGTTFLCDATLAAFTVSLPEASLAGNGFEIYVTKTDSKFKAVTINPYAAELINGLDTIDIDIPYGSVKVICDSVKWYVIAISSSLEVWSDAFGVSPGMADVSANLTAALAELESAGYVRTMRFRAGKYNMNNVSWKGACSLVGEGVRNSVWFTYNGATSAAGTCLIDLILANANVSYARVTDIGFEGWDQSATGQVAERIFKDSGNSSPDLHFHFARVSLTRCWGNALDLGNTRGLVNFHIERMRFDQIGGYGVVISGAATNESRPFSLSRFSYDNAVSATYEQALVARGLYTAGGPWGKGLLHLSDSRGVFVKIKDGRVECNKNLINCAPKKKSIVFIDQVTAGGLVHVMLENITGFARKPDATIFCYDDNGSAAVSQNGVLISYIAKLYESSKVGDEWKDMPGGFSSITNGGCSAGGTTVYSLLSNGNKIHGMGKDNLKPPTINWFEYYKRGDVVINTGSEAGEAAFFFCTDPVNGMALNNNVDFTLLASMTAGSAVISLSANADAFRYMFLGHYVTLVNASYSGDGNDPEDLVVRITDVDADAKTITVTPTPSLTTTTGTIKQYRPKWIEAGQIGYRTHGGNPYGLVVPKFVGERLLDTVGAVWHTATDLVGNRWRVDSSHYYDFNGAVSWDPPQLDPNGIATMEFDVPGVVITDFCQVTFDRINEPRLLLYAHVIQPGRIGVTLENRTTTAANLGNGLLRVRISRLYGIINNSVGPPPVIDPGVSAWDPIAGTGKAAGTPVNWTTVRSLATGVNIVVNNTTELNAAMATAGPGDKILLTGAAGPWSEQWNISASGSAGNKLVIVADTPGTWGARTINKTADKINITGHNIIFGGFKFALTASNQSNALVIAGSNVEMTDVEVMDFVYTSSSSPLLSIRSAAHNTKIHHCHFKSCDGMVVQYDPAYPNFAANCVIEYNDFELTTNKWCQIGNRPYAWLDNHDLLYTGVQVRYNKVLNCESQEFKTSGNVCYRNYIEGSTTSGIGLRAGSGNLVDSNYFKSCNSTVRISGADHIVVNNVFDACDDSVVLKEGSLYSQFGTIYNAHHVRCENTLVAHNTFVNCTGRDIFLGLVQAGRNNPLGPGHNEPYSPYNTCIYNNVAVGAAGVRIYMQTPNTTAHADDPYPTNVDSYHKYVNTEIKNNCNYVTGTGVIGDTPADGGTPSDYIAWSDATQTTGSVISGNIETNPTLINTYRLQTGSPAINTGLAFTKNNWSPSLKKDWDNDTRQQGTAPDMGVEEFA